MQKRKPARTRRTIRECGEKEKHNNKGNLHPGSVAFYHQKGEFIHSSVTLIAQYGRNPNEIRLISKKPTPAYVY